MASVLFSTVGQAVGGPLGALVGGLVGGSMDRALSGSRYRGEARDLFIQSSAYGEVIPRIYGRARQAGILIWAQQSTPGRTGKGSTGSRSSSASFAMALSSGPVASIGRIWADGREFRDRDGNFAGRVTMRIYPGTPGQPVDPLIAAAEGIDRAPAYRGLAYVVFEDLPLAQFGNRLPNLSFELFADLGEGVDDWLADLTRDAERDLEPGAAGELLGYVARSQRRRDDAEMLCNWSSTRMSFPDGRLRLGGGARIVALSTSDLGATAGEIGSGAAPVRTLSTQRRPASCATIYLDPDRDYQRGLQRESRPRHGVERLAEAPVVAGASAARAVACRMLRDGEAAAETLELSLPFRWLAVSVGDILDIENVSGRWRVVRREVEQLIVRLLCERVAPGFPVTNRQGDGGRALPSPLVRPAPTSLLAFEPPADLLDQGAAPGVSVVATGGTGWRGARVTAIRVDGWVETPLGDVRDGCWFGSLVEPAAAGPREYWDEKTELVIASDGDDDGPLGRPDAAVLSGANLLLVGEELVQFRDAVALGGGQFRLRGLLRGRYATRIPSSGHPAGTRVCRIEPPSLMRLPVRAEEAGAALLLVADGVGDPPDGARVEHRVSAAGSAPFAPCHLSARREADGLIVVQWIPRHRGEMTWGSIPRAVPADTVFECRLRSGPNSMTRLVLGEQLVLSAQDQVAGFGSLPDTLVIQVTAVGEGPDWLRSSDEVLVLL